MAEKTNKTGMIKARVTEQEQSIVQDHAKEMDMTSGAYTRLMAVHGVEAMLSLMHATTRADALFLRKSHGIDLNKSVSAGEAAQFISLTDRFKTVDVNAVFDGLDISHDRLFSDDFETRVVEWSDLALLLAFEEQALNFVVAYRDWVEREIEDGRFVANTSAARDANEARYLAEK